MRFGIWPSPQWSWEDILELAEHCERTGWDTVYVADHFMPNADPPDEAGDAPAVDGDTIECWSVLAALAACVPRVRLASLVTSVTYRHPAVLANIAAATDRISGGRLTLGVGAGWQVNEHRAYGLALGSVTERLDRFEEACQVLGSLLRAPRTDFAGRYYELRDAPNQPAPVQARLPLLIGGSGERRMLGIVARFADEWNCWSVPEVLAHKRGVLEQRCAGAGRDPGEIGVSTQALLFISEDEKRVARWRERIAGRPAVIGTPAEVVETMAAYRDAGAGEFIVPGFNMAERAARRDTCDLFMEQVVPALR